MFLVEKRECTKRDGRGRTVAKLRALRALKRRNVVTREDALLAATAPEADEPRGAAAVEVACLHWPQLRAA
jgi:hypothetical protein